MSSVSAIVKSARLRCLRRLSVKVSPLEDRSAPVQVFDRLPAGNHVAGYPASRGDR